MGRGDSVDDAGVEPTWSCFAGSRLAIWLQRRTKVSSPGIGRAPTRSGGPSTFAGSHAHPAHSEDKSVSRPGFEPGRGPSEGPVLSATSSGHEHEREDSDPVNQFWRLAALPGAHSYLFSQPGYPKGVEPLPPGSQPGVQKPLHYGNHATLNADA
jgi:hypothetical protein